MTNPSPPARPAPTTRHIRAIIPADLHDRVAHLAVDLRATLGELFLEALVLLCRYNDAGRNLPEPKAPQPKEKAAHDLAFEEKGGGR